MEIKTLPLSRLPLHSMPTDKTSTILFNTAGRGHEWGAVVVPQAHWAPCRDPIQGEEWGSWTGQSEVTRGSEVEDLQSQGPHSWREHARWAEQSDPASTKLGLTVHRQHTPNGTRVLAHQSVRHHYKDNRQFKKSYVEALKFVGNFCVRGS